MSDPQENRTNEQALRSAILEGAFDSIVGMDSHGCIIEFNPAAERAFGYTRAEALGQLLADLIIPPRFRPMHRKGLEHYLATGEGPVIGKSVEVTALRRDGTEFPVELTVSHVSGTSPPIFAGILRDITERKHAEERLAGIHKQLLETSRLAGMAEVATSVLHNVGNVLNSVSVSADVVVRKVEQFRIGNLQKVAVLLREHAHDLPGFLTGDPRGRELPTYLFRLVEHLTEPQQGILNELESLSKNIEHIKEVVAMQQSYGTMSSVLEPVSIVDLVEDAIRINSSGLSRHKIQLVREYSEVPPAVTDRHKVLQILVNLVGNAKYALAEAGWERRLMVCVAARGTDGVTIAVNDNGAGIASDNLARIFQYGFTTKRDGHGFGLHSGALAAQELGGSLTAYSDGVGRGAVFTLELPLKKIDRMD